MIDFSMSPPLLAGLVAGCALPFILALVARVPVLRGRNALQFTCAASLAFVGWVGVVLVYPGQITFQVLLGAMLLTTFGILWLEIWSLLSRGYTLGLVLTLFQANAPLSRDTLAASYRGGAGVVWIMTHRISGLIAARLVERKGTRLALRRPLGMLVAVGAKVGIAIFGLRRNG